MYPPEGEAVYRNWASSYFSQAESDWRIYINLNEQMVAGLPSDHPVEPCHPLHYLQMFTEKLGKAYLVASGNITPEEARRTHEGFANFLQLASRNHTLFHALGMTPRRLDRYVSDLIPLARMIERLAPQLAGDEPNPEYPWRDHAANEIRVPAIHNDFDVSTEMMSRGHRLLGLIEYILEHHEKLI